MISRVCIFGFGGVLFDTRTAYGNGLGLAFESVDDVYDPSEFDECSSMSLQGLFGLRYKEHPCKYREFVAEFLKGFEKDFPDSGPFHETVGTVKALHERGIVMGIVTESYEEPVRDLLEKHGIRDCFRSIVGFERSVLRRPDPYPLNLCVKELNADPEDVVYVGCKPAALSAADGTGIGKIKLNRSDVRTSSKGTIRDLADLLL